MSKRSKRDKRNDVLLPLPSVEGDAADLIHKMMQDGPMNTFLNVRQLIDEAILRSKRILAAMGQMGSHVVLANEDRTEKALSGEIVYTVMTIDRMELVRTAPLEPKYRALLSNPPAEGRAWVLLVVDDCPGIFEEPVELSMANEATPRPAVKWNKPKGQVN
jgi:hypothetical protein